MITSPPTRKVSIFLLSKDVLVVMHKVGGVVKVLDVIPSILLRAVSSLTNKVFYHAAFIFFHYLIIEQTVYFKRFESTDITVDKHDKWHIRAGAIEEIIDWGRYWLQLSHRENRIHFSIQRNIQLVCKSTYFFKYTK